MTRTALIAMLASPVAEGAKHTGFLTDILCWDLVDAIDGANMQTGPEEHTVHCMRDIQECIDSGFGVLEGPGSNGRYSLKYRFDAAGNANALQLLKTTRKRANFVVTVEGEADGDVLKGATVSEPTEADDAAVVVPLEVRPGPAVLYVHLVCMILAWGLLLPWGAALAARGREHGSRGSWFAAHWKLQAGGVVLMLGGFAAAVVFAEGHTAHFKSPHAQLGLAVVVLGCVQALMGALRPHAPASAEEQRSAERALFEGAHKNGGRLAVVLGIATIGVGIAQAKSLNYDMTVVGVAAGLSGVCVLPVGLYYVLSVCGLPIDGGVAALCYGVLGAGAGSASEGGADARVPKEPAPTTA